MVRIDVKIGAIHGANACMRSGQGGWVARDNKKSEEALVRKGFRNKTAQKLKQNSKGK
ncbi:MAG: hypothetical protein FWD15_01415 [Alphaproteobacteria bacterium]|nr:hypothetical protein [Alphaproteobacteria bacterium]